MANIQSQIKRNARAQRERFENRHYTSAIKTYFRRLETAVSAGDEEQIGAEHRKLVSLLITSLQIGTGHVGWTKLCPTEDEYGQHAARSALRALDDDLEWPALE